MTGPSGPSRKGFTTGYASFRKSNTAINVGAWGAPLSMGPHGPVQSLKSCIAGRPTELKPLRSEDQPFVDGRSILDQIAPSLPLDKWVGQCASGTNAQEKPA